MTHDEKVAEQHGCIVCGKMYHMHVKYDSRGKVATCLVTTPGGRCLPDDDRPIVACVTHSAAEVKRALSGHYPGRQKDEDEDED